MATGSGRVYVNAVREVGNIKQTHQYDVDVRFDIAISPYGNNGYGCAYSISCDGQTQSGSTTFDSNGNWVNIGGTKTFRITMPKSGASKTIGISATINTGISPATVSASGSYSLGAVVWEHTVSYNANGGSGAPGNQIKVYGSVLKLSSTIPVKDGYIFMGWAVSSAGEVKYSPGGTYEADENISLYAVWKIAYIQPTITELKAIRCLSSGTASNDGTYIKVSGTWAVDKTVNSGNKATNLKIEYRISTSSVWTTAVSTNPAAASGTINSIIGGGNISTGGVYFVRVTVTDGGGNISETAIVAAQFRPVDITNDGQTVSFGAAASDKKGVEFHTPVRLYSGSAEIDLYDMLPVPVNSVLYTYKKYNTSPTEDYPWTTWERIKGKVLVGVDENDPDFSTPGKTGGEKTHIVTTNEMPPHNHAWDGVNDGATVTGQQGTYPFRVYQDRRANWNGTRNYMYNTGGGQPHNNLQPYETVYMWKRIS